MYKIFYFFLSFVLFAGCASQKKKDEEMIFSSIHKGAFLNTKGDYQKCYVFAIKDKEYITNHHCLLENKLSFVEKGGNTFFIKDIKVEKSIVDFVVFDLVSDNKTEPFIEEDDSGDLSSDIKIPYYNSNGQPDWILCKNHTGDFAYRKSVCNKQISKGFSGLPILSKNNKLLGVLIGYSKQQKNEVIWSIF